MRVVHRLEVVAVCPVDQKPDIYQCTIGAQRVIPVEDILKAVAAVKEKEIYQEDLCQELHRQLACKVTLIGYHSGVLTEVTCGGDV